MNILYISYMDLVGRSFNGYNLLEYMNNAGHNAKMFVKFKSSDNKNVIKVNYEKRFFNYIQFVNNKDLLSFESNIYSNGFVNDIISSDIYKAADIIHIHITYLQFLSFYDYQKLFENKKIVITLHDTWFLTGGCTNSFECDKYKENCKECKVQSEYHNYSDFKFANAAFEYKLKLFKENNISILYASDLLENYFKSTKMFEYTKHYEKIPFGVEIKGNDFLSNSINAKKYFGVENKFVVGFRNETSFYKGCKYIFEALDMLDEKEIVILTVSKTDIPEKIKNKYTCINLGVVKDLEVLDRFYNACDIFLMPSTNETFGLMAIEAMSRATPVLCFKDTVLEDITFANEDCGISVEKYNSNEIANKLKYFINNKSILEARGKLSYRVVKENYSIEKYVNRHLEFYNKILNS